MTVLQVLVEVCFFSNTGQIGSEWVMVDVANNHQQGTMDRVGQKMLQISEKVRAAIDNGAISSPQATSNEREIQERVEAAVKEERLRAQEVERR